MPFRSVAIAAILIIAGPVSAFMSSPALAASSTAMRLAQNSAPSSSEQSGRSTNMHHHHAGMHRESVEDRIKSLQVQLKITPSEEASWNVVAETMRNNAATMKRMIDEERSRGKHGHNALDDLKTYERFTQAHADAIRKLLDAFSVLYGAMPPDQQKTADEVFSRYEHRRVSK